MIKKGTVVFFTLGLILICSFANAQRTVKVKISFKEECNHSFQQYFVYFKVNDTITFEKFTDSTFVVFNVPKFLIKDTLCRAWVEELSTKQYRGSICEQGLGCSTDYWEEFVSSEVLKREKEVDIHISSSSLIGCGSLPRLNFKYNSSDIRDAYFDYDTLPIGKLYNSVELYCRLDRCFQYPNTDIILYGQSGFYEKRKDSLGFERAMAAKQLLVEFGIDAERIFVKNEADLRAKEEIKNYPKGKKERKLTDEMYTQVWFQLKKSNDKQ